MNSMKKVLIIANLFHASPRIPSIAKYLAEFGWESTILTVPIKEDSRNRLGFPSGFQEKVRTIEVPYQGDIFWFWRKIFKFFGFNPKKSILNQTKEKIGIASQKSFIDSIFNFYQTIFGYPDNEKKWKKPSIKVGSKLLENGKFDAMISSSSPVTAHIITNKLKNTYKIPWVVDLRDLWTQNHNYPYPWWRKIFEKRLELKTFKIADALVTVTPVWAERLGLFHKNEKVYSITNGFNPEEINIPPAPLTKKFTVIYSGTLYIGKQDPNDFFLALKELVSEGVIKREDIEISFYSGKQTWLEEEVRKYKLEKIVNIYEKIPKTEIVKKEKESQVLLLICWGDKKEKGWYPLKIFGYLATQRPILVIGGFGEDVIEKLISNTKSGVYCKNITEIKNFLKKAYLEYKNKGGVRYEGNLDEINHYSYREKAKEFADILNQII